MWSGKYHIVNNTGSTITDLTASVGRGNDKTWDQTAAGEGWIHPNLGAEFLIVSWKDEAGSHQKRFSFERKVNAGSKTDVYVELKLSGNLAWRVIEPPPEDGSVEAIFALACVYLGYCLVACLVIGVPVALAALVAYGLFKVIKTGVSATVQGLHGDRTVFQFSIREILLLTTVVALVCGWFVTYLAIRQ